MKESRKLAGGILGRMPDGIRFIRTGNFKENDDALSAQVCAVVLNDVESVSCLVESESMGGVRVCKVTVIKGDGNYEGIVLRNQTIGPELTMLSGFAEELAQRYRSKGGISRVLVVFEPLIDSGYPDLVVLRYTTTFMNHWKESRRALRNPDLKILSYLMAAPSSERVISKSLGFSKSNVALSISRLYDSGVIFHRGSKWHALRQDRLLGLKSIDSYEAKMQAVSVVHRQAMLNKRFSSTSYAIVKSKQPTGRTKMLFERSGIGLLADGGRCQTVAPQPQALPNSYVTLQFNEWVARCIAEGEMT